MDGEPSKSGCGLPNVFVDFNIQGEIVTYRESMVCELVDNFQLIIVNCDGGLCLHILSKYISFFQTDCEPRVSTYLEEAVHQVLELLLSMCCHCSIISKEYVPDEGLEYFGSCSEAGQIEQVAICPRVEIDAFS